MAETILAAASKSDRKHQYRLPEADRQAILAQSPGYIKRIEIERQRQAFMALNDGLDFGQQPIHSID